MNGQMYDADADFQRAYVPFEIEEIHVATTKAGDSIGEFSGKAAVFNNEDMMGDVIKPGAFKGSIGSPKKIKMLWQHSSFEPVGVWDKFEETPNELRAEGRLLLDVQRAAEAHVLMKAGAVDGLSVGFRIPKNGATFDDDTGKREITKAVLWEVSLVTFPANPKARMTSVKSAAEQITTKREFEKFLRDVGGFSVATAKAISSSGFIPDPAARDVPGEGLSTLYDALMRRGASLNH
jgi:HK97 family phage prohead protease